MRLCLATLALTVSAMACELHHTIGCDAEGLHDAAVAAWEMNEGTGDIAVDSIAGRNATRCVYSADAGDVEDGCLMGADGPQCVTDGTTVGLAFDGQNDGLRLDPNPALDLPVLSVEARVRWKGPADFDQQRIIDRARGTTSGATPEWNLDVMSGGAVRAELRTGLLTWSQVQSADGVMPHDAWTHLVMTTDGQTLRTYLDGQPLNEQQIDGGIYFDEPRHEGLGLGNQWSRNRAFSGSIDFIRLYPRALSADDVSLLYGATCVH